MELGPFQPSWEKQVIKTFLQTPKNLGGFSGKTKIVENLLK